MNDMDIPEDYPDADVAMLGYQLALCMMKASGEINQDELDVAIEMGEVVLPHFSRDEFLHAVQHTDNVPSHRVTARLIGDLLPEEGKEAIVNYLWEIAQADNETPPEEEYLLLEVADALGLDVSVITS